MLMGGPVFTPEALNGVSTIRGFQSSDGREELCSAFAGTIYRDLGYLEQATVELKRARSFLMTKRLSAGKPS